MPKNLNGNSLSQAKAISSTTSISGKLGKDNLFSFNLSNSSSLNLKFKSSSQAASLRFIQDRNQNGLADAGEALKTLSVRSKKTGSVSISPLNAGTYFLQVSPSGRGNSSYRLSLSSTALPGQIQAQTASNGVSNSPLQNFVSQVLQLTNNFRQQNGLASLALNGQLSAAAQTQSQNMALQDFFAHEGKDGSEPWNRMSSAGYRWSTAAENIAAGQQTPDQVVQAWINSPGHRANMLNPKLKDIGVGYYFLANDTGSVNYNSYWTQDFGAPA